jgi:hypothetical protein
MLFFSQQIWVFRSRGIKELGLMLAKVYGDDAR